MEDLQREFQLTLENTENLYKQALGISNMMSSGDEINALMSATLEQMKANGWPVEPLPTDYDVTTMLHLTQSVASTLRREAKA